MTAAEKYIADCRKWHDEHQRKNPRNGKKPFYQVLGCKIYVGTF